jgi:hypothetical protein
MIFLLLQAVVSMFRCQEGFPHANTCLFLLSIRGMIIQACNLSLVVDPNLRERLGFRVKTLSTRLQSIRMFLLAMFSVSEV